MDSMTRPKSTGRWTKTSVRPVYIEYKPESDSPSGFRPGIGHFPNGSELAAKMSNLSKANPRTTQQSNPSHYRSRSQLHR
jgi:hypothetical protein